VNRFLRPLKLRVRALPGPIFIGLLFIVLCLASRGQAQVSVDMHALDPSGTARPPQAQTPSRPVVKPKPAPRRVSAARKPTPAGKAVANGTPSGTSAVPNSSRPATATPTPAPASSAAVANAPIPALPTERPAEPPASTTVPATEQTLVPLPSPVRLVFDKGQTDLTPDDEAEIKDLARSIPMPAVDSINVLAYAAGKPDDPSTARRLSLSRGMAVRSILLASGVPSAQIYVRALGATASDGPADRVELIVAPIGTLAR
jgi:outer membrane protein OmpA-like peptidoglycan-associated protein